MLDPALQQEMLGAVPRLRAFAASLSGSLDRADDLVQETLLKALANIDSFQVGTNMQAWLFTILRNHFRSEHRKRRREVEDVDGRHSEGLTAKADQIDHIELAEMQSALQELPADQREAVVLIGALGFSYEEAAAVCDCAVGTIKSRLSRGRSRLAGLLDMRDGTGDGPALTAGGGVPPEA